MNTVTDLRHELRELADRAPADAAVRTMLAARIAVHAKRRRATTLIAAAAAVVLVAGGAGIAGAVISHRSSGPATPSPVVSVPDIPLPADTKLIRDQLQPVVSPVTATPPNGLSGQAWFASPGRLAVSYFDPSHGGAKGSAAQTQDSEPVATAGYVVTQARNDPLYAIGPGGVTTPAVHSSTVTIAGHQAILETAPARTLATFGFPASERISWQLGDGRWIHTWFSGQRDLDPLKSFAASISEQPQILDRTVGIGLTLPGLTVDSSMNSSPIASVAGAMLDLCRPGVDPMPFTYLAVSTSRTASEAPTKAELAASPINQCVFVSVLNYPVGTAIPDQGSTVTVGGTTTHVIVADGRATASLGNGLVAAISAPVALDLSQADLAALVASVRVSPAVGVQSPTPPQVIHGSAVATGATSAMANPAPGAASRNIPSPQLSIPGGLPTARTTIPPAGDVGGPAATPITAPINLELDQ